MVNRSPENEKELDVKLEWVPVQGPDGKSYFSPDATSACGTTGLSLRSIGRSCLARYLWWEKPKTGTREYKRTSATRLRTSSIYESTSTGACFRRKRRTRNTEIREVCHQWSRVRCASWVPSSLVGCWKTSALKFFSNRVSSC